MYENFFGLRERPFDLTPNPRFLFLTPGHREALTIIKYGVFSRKGLTVVVGEAGTGKTTLIRAAFQEEGREAAHELYLSDPTLTRTEYLQFLAQGFRLAPETAESKHVLFSELQRTLRGYRERNVSVALVVDEAQMLSDELLEEIRLLGNIETETDKLLPVVMVGQPELAQRLNHPALRQLKQRIALRCTVSPLTEDETAAYISKRIQSAGGTGDSLFSEDAVALIFHRSQGIPRVINVICDNSLVTSFACQERMVTTGVIQEVCRDLDFDG